MTDEEKAEKYILEVVRPQRIEITPLNVNRELKNAFVVGIKEGEKEKWHDLRKNPNDLPKEGEEVLVLYSNFYDDNGLMVNKYTLRYKLAQYINDEDDLTEWYWVESGLDDMVHEVIAWCELPRFEE